MSHPLTGGWEKSPLLSIDNPTTVIDKSQYRSNAVWSSERYPEIKLGSFLTVKLAVVGGGDSARKWLPVLKYWKGEIWAVKGAAKWLSSHGIKSTMVSCHPVFDGDDFQPDQALLSSSCAPEQFEALKCPVRIFHADSDLGVKINGGCTTLTKTPHLALMMGYTGISYFGCDSSMGKSSHVYTHKETPYRLTVVCGDREYVTQPDWVYQAEYLHDIFKMAPRVFINHSDGFVKALVEHGTYYIKGEA